MLAKRKRHGDIEYFDNGKDQLLFKEKVEKRIKE